MRWIFWRRKPSSEITEPRSLPDSKPEEITVFIEAAGSSHRSQDVRNVILQSAAVPDERDRWSSRHRRHAPNRSGNLALLRENMEELRDPPRVLQLVQHPRKPQRSLPAPDPRQPDRLAYFARGEYTSRGLNAVRLTAPAVASVIAQRRTAIGNPKAPADISSEKHRGPAAGKEE